MKKQNTSEPRHHGRDLSYPIINVQDNIVNVTINFGGPSAPPPSLWKIIKVVIDILMQFCRG